MVKEISIFNEQDSKLTRIDKDILFERLSNEGIDINRYHFKSFNELDSYSDDRLSSNIPSLMIKNIINNIGVIVQKNTSKDYKIAVQFNRPINVWDVNFTSSEVIPSNKKINISSIYFDNRNGYFNNTRFSSYLETEPFLSKVYNGSYGLYSWFNDSTSNKYMQENTDFRLSEKRFNILLTGDEQAKNVINLIEEYNDFYNSYYNENLYFMYDILPKNTYKKFTNLVIKKEIPDTPLLQLINSIYTNKTTNVKTVFLYDVLYGNLWDIYQNATILGLGNKEVKELIDEEKKRQNTNRLDKINEINILNNKHKTLKKITLAKTIFNKDYITLTEKEKDIVDLQYDTDESFSSYVMNNKCIHLDLLEKTMKSKSADSYLDISSWKQLSDLVPLNSNNEMLKCSLCKLPVLCPHHYDLFDYKAKQQLSRSKGDKDIMLQLMSKYADKTAIKNAYYCKICGEKIIHVYDEQHEEFVKGERVKKGYDIDPLYMKIWKNTRITVLSNIDFLTVTDIRPIVTDISESILPYIEEENEKLNKNKINTEELIQDTIQFYMTLYVMVHLARLVTYHPGDIKFKVRNTKDTKVLTKMGGDSTNSKLLQDTLKIAFNIFAKNTVNLIKRIPSISTDSLKPLFIRSFKKISNTYSKTIEFNTELPAEYVVNSIIYSYLFYVKRKSDNDLKYYNVKKILNVNLVDLKNLDNITDKVTVPPKWDLKTNFVNPLYDTGYVKKYNEYSYMSFTHFMKFILDKLFNIPVFGSIKHENNRKDFMQIRKIGKSLRLQLEGILKLNNKLYFHRQYGKYNYTDIELTKIFCKDGKKHKFDIYIYENKDEIVEISRKNVKEWMGENNNLFIKFKKIDVKCSLCGDLLSKSKGNGDILNTLNTNEEITGFYNLYMFKCPKGNIHTFDNNKCTKCGVTKDMLFKKDIEYFKKFKDSFKEFTTPKKNNVKKITLKPEKKDQLLVKSWVINTSPIYELSKLTKIPYNVLNNIGAVENRDFSKIESGELETVFNQYRVSQLETYMNNFIIEYKMLRDMATIYPILESFISSRGDIDFTKFPDVAIEYNELYEYYTKTKLNNEKMVNFILYSLSNSMITIYKYFVNNKEYKTAAIDFITYYINRIITIEKSISDAGILSGKVLEIEDDGDDEVDAVDADYYDYNFTEDENFDPFSLEKSGIDANIVEDNVNTGDD